MRIYWGTLFKKHTPDKDKFPFGITFYDAPQGGGKTLSMVFDAQQLKKEYPDLHLISNVVINGWKDALYFQTPDELIVLLERSDDWKHTLIIIDEALTYFAENGGIDPGLMSAITQNRKVRRLMFIATQKFKRTNNRLRDFSLRTVKCRSFLCFQYNVVRDDSTTHWDKEEMDFIGDKLYSYIFKRHNDLYNSYDTFAKIKIDKNINTQYLMPARAPAQAQAIIDNKKGIFNVQRRN